MAGESVYCNDAPLPHDQGRPCRVQIWGSDEGGTFAVWVIPRARTTGVDGVRDGALVVRVTAPPIGGAANAAVLSFFADVLGIPISRLALVRGEHGRRKSIRVRGCSVAELATMLSLLEGAS